MARASFLKHAAVYGASHLLVNAASFLLLPLYVRCLNPSEYGLLDVFNRLGEVLILCLLYNGLRQALLAFHNQSNTDEERRAVVGSALTLTAVLLLGGGGLFFLFADPITGWLDAGSPTILRWATVSVVLESFALMLLALAQARVESTFFAVVNFVHFLIRVVLCIALVVGFGWGIEGVLIGSSLSSACVLSVLMFREVRRGMSLNWRQIKAMTRFALPFVPGGLGFFLLNSGDRLVLLEWVSKGDIGMYALGCKLALVVKLLTRRPLYMVWSAQMYSAAKQPDAARVFGQVFTRVLAAYAFVGLGLCVVADEVVQIISGSEYAGAASVIAPVVLAYFFLSAADLMDAAFYVQRRTAWKTPITLASTVLVLLLYVLCIPRWGIHGAAFATMIGFAFQASFTFIVTQRIFPVCYEWTRIVSGLGMAVGLWLVGLTLPVGLWWMPVKIGLALAWPLLLWLCGLVSPEERRYLRDSVTSLCHRLVPSRPAPVATLRG